MRIRTFYGNKDDDTRSIAKKTEIQNKPNNIDMYSQIPFEVSKIDKDTEKENTNLPMREGLVFAPMYLYNYDKDKFNNIDNIVRQAFINIDLDAQNLLKEIYDGNIGCRFILQDASDNFVNNIGKNIVYQYYNEICYAVRCLLFRIKILVELDNKDNSIGMQYDANKIYEQIISMNSLVMNPICFDINTIRVKLSKICFLDKEARNDAFLNGLLTFIMSNEESMGISIYSIIENSILNYAASINMNTDYLAEIMKHYQNEFCLFMSTFSTLSAKLYTNCIHLLLCNPLPSNCNFD